MAGILNGTTNFILTKMIRENMELADAGVEGSLELVDVDSLGSADEEAIAAKLGHPGLHEVGQR